APAEAHDFLDVAARSAEVVGITPQPAFFVALGTSCARTGRFAEALHHFDRALRGEPDGLRRADVLAQVALVHNSAWSPDRGFDAVRRGLAELGTPLPRGRLGLAVTTLASVVRGIVAGRTRLGFGAASGRRREQYRLQAVLYDAGASAATMRMRRGTGALMSLRALHAINRLGPGREYARHMSGLALIADVAGRPNLATRLYDRAAAAAADIGDPELVGYVEWRRGAGSHLGGRDDDGQIWMRALVEHERWLGLGEYLTGVSTVCVQLFTRGRTSDADSWYLRGKARLGPDAEAEGAAIGAVAAAIASLRGRADEATAHIEALRRFLRAYPDNPMQLINLYAARMIALVEQGQLGEPFDRLTAEFAALGLRPASVLTGQRVYYIYEALGRLARCHRAGVEASREDRAAAEEVVARLGKVAETKPLRAFHRVARADLEVLAGRPQDAVRTLADIEAELLPLDAPLIAYEAARVRARALGALDLPASATYQAEVALIIAVDQQWPQRIRWIGDEFRVGEPGSANPSLITTTGGGRGGTGEDTAGPSAGGGDAALYRRRLEALQQVSLASATVLDPRRLARVALDETLRILGAERAYLFLLDLDLNQLVPHVGRDGEGNDIQQLTGYSSTLVDRVRHSGEPLVVTGSEEGVALGSQSAQIHGLRSILIAPLEFDGHLRGVVYLDSRVAKGVFTSDDVDILKAITNHIAVSLETARAAQLEVAVQAARRQRDVAETLRAAMADQSSSLDPDEVMRRLLTSLTHTLGGNSAVLLTRRDDDRLVVAVAHGAAAAVGTQLHPTPSDLLDLTGHRVRTVGPGEGPPFGELLDTPRSWWAISVAERGEPFGILLVGASRDGVMTEAQSQIAAAIAGQGMTAYENARLFSQVRQMATVDGLTGLYNRNHFFAEAERQLRIARQQIAAVMVDIDHFKRINDTYGHPVGDEVIRLVAGRLRDAVRDSDVLGRYGGEEFALVTPHAGASAAELAERLRQAVSGDPVPTAAGPLPVTISVGLAHPRGGEQDLRQLLTRADEALYQAKQTGRDRVCIAP
ncbi:MAG TPA: sensor domain-containing diguanylate cyclase, partial [Actinoplanes sp.]|nr:sensor domain-containing diguanylate cyclase [Actinoplanes sp.]